MSSETQTPQKYTVETRHAIKLPGDVYRDVRLVAAHRGISAAQAMVELISAAARAEVERERQS